MPHDWIFEPHQRSLKLLIGSTHKTAIIHGIQLAPGWSQKQSQSIHFTWGSMPPDPHTPACLHMHTYIAHTPISKQSILTLPRLVYFLQACSGKHTSVVVSQATPKLAQGYISSRTYIRIMFGHSSPFHRMTLHSHSWNKPFDRATTNLSFPRSSPAQLSTPSLFISISCSHYTKFKAMVKGY